MEALVAVGLASNIVQLIDFTSELLQTYNNLRHDGALPKDEYRSALLSHLIPLSDKIKGSANKIAQSSGTLPLEQKTLQAVADGCHELAGKLLKRVDTLRHSHNDGQFRRAKVALRILWNKREMDDMINQLEHFKSQLSLHMISEVWDFQTESRAVQPTKDDIKAISDGIANQIKRLETSLDALRVSFNNTAAHHQTQVMHSITNLAAENSQLHTEIQQRVTASSHAVLNTVNNIQQILYTQHEETMNNLAQVRVQNSKFHASMAIQEASIQDGVRTVLQPLLQEYQETILDEVRKEFRGTARAEMERLHSMLAQPLDGTEHLYHKGELGHFPTRDEVEYHDTERCLPEFWTFPDTDYKEANFRQALRHRKSTTSVTYRNSKFISTRLGALSLYITNTVHFRPGQAALNTYCLDLDFRPFPQWFSTGYSIAYQKVTDGRGPPKFGFQFPTYRIIPQDHGVWRAIKNNDLSTIQSMLSRRAILPSDQRDDGVTLLEYAVAAARVNICKALIHSGVDANALLGCQDSPVLWALTFTCYGNAQHLDIFCYLQCLPGINLECLWLNEAYPLELARIILKSLGIQKKAKLVIKVLSRWAPLSRSTEADLDIPDQFEFLQAITHVWSDPEMHPHSFFNPTKDETDDDTDDKWVFFLEELKAIFDAIIDESGKLKSLEFNRQIPVALAAVLITDRLKMMASEDEDAYREPSSVRTVYYHGYYVEPPCAFSCRFLEHVIAMGFKQRADSIFDDYDGYTIFRHLLRRFDRVYYDILNNLGVDPIWAVKESLRRKRVTIGHASAHDIDLGIETADIPSTRRRKAFTASQD
ncbi:hypothetical protein HD806DRAFT_492300, partial [Xylariaceae sp. AK1471]